MQAPQAIVGQMLRAPTQIIENTYNLYCNPQGKRRLPNDFQPGPYDVICARGKKAHDNEGNVRFRALVEQHQDEYAQCTCKYEKSKIVSYITNSIRQACAYHQGGFVKNVDGLWYEVGDRAAKEKIGQTFRDLLHTKYSSSTKAKAKARIQKRVGDNENNGSGELEDEATEHEEEKHTKMKRKSSFTMNIKLPAFAKSMNPLRSSDNGKDKKGIAESFSSFLNPDKPLSDEKVLDHLRSSVQTVDSDFRMSTTTISLSGVPPTEEEWMKLSTNSNPFLRSSNSKRPAQLAMSDLTNPDLTDLQAAINFRHDETAFPNHHDDMDDDDYDMDTFGDVTVGDRNGTTINGGGDAARPYGIFSSSTKSNPFSESMLLSSSVNSRNNPLLRSSTRSSFMEMDLDGLLESMGSINMIEGAHAHDIHM